MATIKEFKEWLNRFPDDTTIEVAFQQRPRNYESYGPIEFKTIQLTESDYGDGWEFYDFRNNKYVTENHPLFNKCILTLGEQD